MIRLLRADQRYVTRQPGIVTFSCFASGGHYDPDNLSFDRLVAVDEHVLQPGAGFALHPHRGVDLVSYVRSGTLRNEDEDGETRLLVAGALQVQHAGGGIRHAEWNASDTDPLQLVQMALLSELDATGRADARLPVRLPGATLTGLTAPADLPPARRHLQVVDGRFTDAASGTELCPGDSLRADAPLRLTGAGLALLWTFA